MNPGALIGQLEGFLGVLPALVGGLDGEEARWRPNEGAWSILEVAGHLADEEVEDFRTRTRLCLEDPRRVWPGIDPGGSVLERRHNEGDLGETIQRFEKERAESVAWLRGLEAPKWDNTYEHPELGPLTAGDLLTSWAAHDALHLRQLAQRHFQLTRRHAGEHSTAYAGKW